jgi:hypothetical protein
VGGGKGMIFQPAWGGVVNGLGGAVISGRLLLTIHSVIN